MGVKECKASTPKLRALRDALAATVVRAGGLLRSGHQRLPGAPGTGLTLSPARAGEGGGEGESGATREDPPRTLFQKIVDRHLLASADTGACLGPGDGGFVRADLRFIHEYYTGMCAHLLREEFGDALALHDPASIVAFEDHLSYVHASPVHVAQGLLPEVCGLSRAHRDFVERHGLTHHGYLQALDAGDPRNAGSQGISHAMVAERYAMPDGAKFVIMDEIQSPQPPQLSPTATNANPFLPYWFV